jgi:hypothetical protein
LPCHPVGFGGERTIGTIIVGRIIQQPSQHFERIVGAGEKTK